MPNIIFYLNTGAKDKEDRVPLMAKIIYNRKRHYKKIARIKADSEFIDENGEKKVKRGDWNPRLNRMYKNHKNAPYNGHREIDATITILETLTRRYNDYCIINEHPVTESDIEAILNGIDPINGVKTTLRPDVTFNQAFEDWVKFTKTNLEHNTYRSRNSVYNFFQDFQKDENFRISFKNIDMLLFDRLKQYAFSDKKKYANNTFAKTIKVLKIFLNWCEERGYYSGKLPKGFKASERDITPITLTVDEFKTIYHKDFESKKHQKTRDIFCFGCLTGLRYSDLMRVRRDMVQDGYLYLTIKKVKEPKKIPLVDMAITILDRYKEQPVYALPHISNQKFNTYLKEVCKEAEIEAPVTIDTYSGNKWTQVTQPKHKLITAHVARKTFITLSFYLGMNIKVVQEITGIKQEATLRKYLQIADLLKQEEMNKAWGKL
jgi:integrase